MELLFYNTPMAPTAELIDKILGILLVLFFASLALSCADIDWPWTRQSWKWSSYKWDWPWSRDD